MKPESRSSWESCAGARYPASGRRAGKQRVSPPRKTGVHPTPPTPRPPSPLFSFTQHATVSTPPPRAPQTSAASKVLLPTLALATPLSRLAALILVKGKEPIFCFLSHLPRGESAPPRAACGTLGESCHLLGPSMLCMRNGGHRDRGDGAGGGGVGRGLGLAGDWPSPGAGEGPSPAPSLGPSLLLCLPPFLLPSLHLPQKGPGANHVPGAPVSVINQTFPSSRHQPLHTGSRSSP